MEKLLKLLIMLNNMFISVRGCWVSLDSLLIEYKGSREQENKGKKKTRPLENHSGETGYHFKWWRRRELNPRP
jgi:hypothetical protein